MRLIDADALKKDDELTEWITRDTIRTGKMLKAFSELFVKKIDDAPTINAVSEEVYTEEYNLRKDAELKVYKLERALKQEPQGMTEIDFIQPKKTVGKLISVDVLDKIRAEIEAYQSDAFYPDDVMMNRRMVLEIIDKYRGGINETDN